MSKVCKLKDKKTARKIGEFLTSSDAFEHTWFPDEKVQVKKAVIDSLKNKNHQYWYIEKDGAIIGAIGVRENKCGNGGYEMDADYVSVHKQHRREKLGSKLLQAMEQYVKKRKGRYYHVLTCDTKSYIPANKFYEKHGYKKVGHIPDYYVEGEGRIDYFKEVLKK